MGNQGPSGSNMSLEVKQWQSRKNVSVSLNLVRLDDVLYHLEAFEDAEETSWVDLTV
jgi:hypothetical protein